MASRVDKIYGDAYISVKTDEDDLLEALEEAKAVKEILDSNTDFVNFLNHPQITKEEKMEAAKNVFDGRVSDDMTGFLMIIIKKGRFKEFDGIFTYIISNIKTSVRNRSPTCNVSNAAVTRTKRQDLKESHCFFRISEVRGDL